MVEIKRLPVGDLGLLTAGFRFTDRPNENWTRRFNRFKYGEPTAARAATRTFCAAFEGFHPTGGPRVVVVSWISSGQNIVQYDTPASTLASELALSRGWEWPPHHIIKDEHPRISGLVLVVVDFCTRGATLADIARATLESNPGWQIQPVSLAKAERAAYWTGKLTNAHIPDFLDATWRGDPEVASPDKNSSMNVAHQRVSENSCLRDCPHISAET